MAVTRVALKDMPSGSANAEPNGLLYEIVRRKYTLEFFVFCSSHRDTQIDVLGFATTPKCGDTFALFSDVDAIATCVSVDAKRLSPYVWVVTANYDTDRIVAAVTDNPLNQPADIKYRVITVEKPMLRDKTGLLIRNSAGTPYDPPVMELVKLLQVSITQNLATYDAAQALLYVDAVNDATYNGVPYYSLKIVDRTGDRQFSRGIQYFQVNTVLEADPRTYSEFILDQGYRKKDKTLFHDPIDFSLPSEPTLMNGRGGALRDSVVPLAVAMTTIQTNATHNDAVKVPLLFPPPVTISGGNLVPPYWFFFIRIDDEIMKVTGITTTDFAVVRAQGGTTAATHSVGASIQLEPYFMFYNVKDTKDFTVLGLPTF